MNDIDSAQLLLSFHCTEGSLIYAERAKIHQLSCQRCLSLEYGKKDSKSI